jgi:hypothetical protein
MEILKYSEAQFEAKDIGTFIGDEIKTKGVEVKV